MDKEIGGITESFESMASKLGVEATHGRTPDVRYDSGGILSFSVLKRIVQMMIMSSQVSVSPPSLLKCDLPAANKERCCAPAATGAALQPLSLLEHRSLLDFTRSPM